MHLSWGHGIDHKPEIPQARDVFAEINAEYKKDVKPIFQKSCFDCHGGAPNYPWYYKVPGIKALIDSDVREAKEHLDMSVDFPFAGHGSPAEDLDAIEKSLNSTLMPPFRYRIMHQKTRLTESELKTVLGWIARSRKLTIESTHKAK